MSDNSITVAFTLFVVGASSGAMFNDRFVADRDRREALAVIEHVGGMGDPRARCAVAALVEGLRPRGDWWQQCLRAETTKRVRYVYEGDA